MRYNSAGNPLYDRTCLGKCGSTFCTCGSLFPSPQQKCKCEDNVGCKYESCEDCKKDGAHGLSCICRETPPPQPPQDWEKQLREDIDDTLAPSRDWEKECKCVCHQCFSHPYEPCKVCFHNHKKDSRGEGKQALLEKIKKEIAKLEERRRGRESPEHLHHYNNT